MPLFRRAAAAQPPKFAPFGVRAGLKAAHKRVLLAAVLWLALLPAATLTSQHLALPLLLRALVSSPPARPSAPAATATARPLSRPVAPPLLPSDVNASTLDLIVRDNTNLVYFPHADMLLMTLAKSATTALFYWLFRGSTGVPFDLPTCGVRYVQNVSSPCWKSEAFFLYDLDPDMQRHALFGNTTLRVAVQRDPYKRLLSAFKSKVACDSTRFGTDVRNRNEFVPRLRRWAEWPSSSAAPPCMPLEEFARALLAARDALRLHGKSLRLLDPHIRPQQFFFDVISYDLVLDVSDLARSFVLRPVRRRLRFGHLTKISVPRRHESATAALQVKPSVEAMLKEFARESRQGVPRLRVPWAKRL